MSPGKYLDIHSSSSLVTLSDIYFWFEPTILGSYPDRDFKAHWISYFHKLKLISMSISQVKEKKHRLTLEFLLETLTKLS